MSSSELETEKMLAILRLRLYRVCCFAAAQNKAIKLDLSETTLWRNAGLIETSVLGSKLPTFWLVLPRLRAPNLGSRSTLRSCAQHGEECQQARCLPWQRSVQHQSDLEWWLRHRSRSGG